MTRTNRLATAVVVSAATTVLFASPSFAVPPLSAADVWIDSWSGGWARLCGRGDVNDGATTIARWVFTVAGAVSEPFPVGPFVLVADGDTFSYCETLYVGSPPDAAFTITLAFTGLRTDAGVLTTDVAGGAVLFYEWNSVLGHGNEVSFGSAG